MDTRTTKEHWETVYETKTPDQVSWTQEIPSTSLNFIASFGLDKSVKIIDIGGGDSNLVDFLVEAGYENITVLDISEKAIEKAKQRLGKRANLVHWIISDIAEFVPESTFDVWHDRASFHFLSTADQIQKYSSIVGKFVTKYMVIGTFSKTGPTKCSGLPIVQYSKESLEEIFNGGFEKIECLEEDHKTPFDTIQNFVFCSFRKINI